MSGDKSYTTEDLLLFIDKLRRENNQLKEQVQDLKADYGTIAQIERDLYKEVIEEVREYTNDKLFDDYTYCSYEDLKQNINEILDKVKVDNERPN